MLQALLDDIYIHVRADHNCTRKICVHAQMPQLDYRDLDAHADCVQVVYILLYTSHNTFLGLIFKASPCDNQLNGDGFTAQYLLMGYRPGVSGSISNLVLIELVLVG